MFCLIETVVETSWQVTVLQSHTESSSTPRGGIIFFYPCMRTHDLDFSSLEIAVSLLHHADLRFIFLPNNGYSISKIEISSINTQ